MKVLLICNKAPFPTKDGAAIAIFNMATGLIKNGVEVHLLAINTKKHFSSDSDIPKEFVKSTNYQSVYRDTDVNIFGAMANLASQSSYFVSRFYFKRFSDALTQKLIAVDFDVVQIEGVFMATYLPLIRKYSKAKVVLRAHNIEYVIWERYLKVSKNILKNFYINLHKVRLKKFEVNIFNEVDAIVPITKIDADVLKTVVCDKPIFYAITGVDLEKYPYIESAVDLDSIFYFGSMDWFPNIQAVEWFKENCWEDIKSRTSNRVRWIIAGRNIPQHILALESDPRIKTISNVDNAFAFYKQYNVQLTPMLSGSGLRIKLIEGAAYGKPIVTTAVGMEGLSFKHGEELLIADTAGEFADAVVKLLNNDNQIQKVLSQNVRKYAEENFDNVSVVKRLVAFYNSLQSVFKN